MRASSRVGLCALLLLGSLACKTAAPLKPITAPVVEKRVVQPLVAAFSERCLYPPAEVTDIVQESAIGAGLAAAFIPKAVGAAIDFVGQLLIKAGEDKKTIMKATAGPHLYRVKAGNAKSDTRPLELLPDARCLHLLSFRDPIESKPVDWSSVVAGTSRTADQIAAVQNSLNMTSNPVPAFFMELVVVLSEDKSSFRLMPTFLRYGSSFSGSARDAELLGAITFGHPDAEKPFASAVILLRGLHVNTTYDLESLVGSATDWMPFDSPSKKAEEARTKPFDKDVAEEPQLFDPVNVNTVLTETQDGIKLLKALGELIVGTKEDVTKLVGESLPSEEKKEAKEASQLDDRNAYVTAIAEVKVKEAELAAETQAVGKAKAQAELIKAQLEANKQALKAGLKLPFPTLYSDGKP